MAKPLQHQIISRALDLIRDETNWTTIYVARTASGSPCSCMDERAVRFCAIGALARAAQELVGTDERIGVERAYQAEKFVLAANNRPYQTLPAINDREGHAIIVALFKQALAS
jgi:hypothetical protein